MKIIDFEKKGNVVRFYLGDDNCEDYWGDDWDDRPYDCNAGRVYSQFVKGHKDIAFPFDDTVLEPCQGGGYNAEYSKEEMKNRIVPCIIVVPKQIADTSYCPETFSHWAGADGVQKFYFGDKMEADSDVD